MSLIGDALKRTQANTATRPPTPVLSVKREPVRPVKTPPPVPVSRNPIIYALAGLAVALVVAVIAYWQLRSFFAERANAVSQVTVPSPAPSTAIRPSVTAPVEKLAASITPPLPARVAQVTNDTSKAETPPPPKPAPKPIAPAPRMLPKLVLQGVTIQGGLREVLINGQTLGVGDVIDEARVLAIDSRSVRMQFDGREVVLRLP